MASYPRRQQSLKDVQILTCSMLCCNTVHAISTSEILHTNTSGTVDNVVGKLRALGKDFCKESCNYSEGLGISLARDLNHSIVDGLDNVASNSSDINVRSITRALLQPILKL